MKYVVSNVQISHPQAKSEHTFVHEWLTSIGAERDIHCCSDSYLQLADDVPILRQSARSAPTVGCTQNSDDLPPSPPFECSSSADMASRPVTPSINNTGSSWPSGRRLVENPLYRDWNLAANNIYMRTRRDQRPDHVDSLLEDIRHDRDSPVLMTEEVWGNKLLEQLGITTVESDVESYFLTTILPYTETSGSLNRIERQSMAIHSVPCTASASDLKVSTPVPDVLYGYNTEAAFTEKQRTQLLSMGTEMVASRSFNPLLYPFFLVEFKGDSGNMAVGANQCLGGSASCVNVAETLNRRLIQCKSQDVRTIDSTAFSIVMNGCVARVYVTWKHNDRDYYMTNVDNFLLVNPDHYIKFCKYVRNIIDWGKGRRLEGIQNALDCLLEESRMTAAAEAKCRTLSLPTSDGSPSNKKRKF